MDPKTAQLAQILGVAAAAATLIFLLVRYPLGRVLVLALMVFLGLTLAVVALRHLNEPLLRRWHSRPALRPAIAFFLRVAGETLPPVPSGPEPKRLALETRADFAASTRAIRAEVFGQDVVVDRLMARLETAVGVRSRSQRTGAMPPLGTFLFVGGEGIGKRFLAGRVNHRLFKSGGLWECDVNQFDEPVHAMDLLFGTRQRTGDLLAAVRQNPYGTVVIENIEALPPKKLQPLLQALDRGTVVNPQDGTGVDFRNCVFILTTSLAHDDLARARARAQDHSHWMKRAAQTLQTATPPLDARLLSLLRDVFVFQDPDDDAIYNVVEAIIRQELQGEQITLNRIHPEIMGPKLAEFHPEYGFSLVRGQVRTLLEPYIKYCKENGLSVLDLKPSMID